MPGRLTIKHRNDGLRADLLTALIHLRSEALLEAAVAGCAVIAHSDGEVAPAERQLVFGLMRHDPLLSMFPRDVVQRAFALQHQAFSQDPDAARQAALRQVATLADRPRHALVVLEACRVMTSADRRVHPGEIEALARVRHALGFSDGGAARSDVARAPAASVG
jgi:tellurite resistance protein TerB